MRGQFEPPSLQWGTIGELHSFINIETYSSVTYSEWVHYIIGTASDTYDVAVNNAQSSSWEYQSLVLSWRSSWKNSVLYFQRKFQKLAWLGRHLLSRVCMLFWRNRLFFTKCKSDCLCWEWVLYLLPLSLTGSKIVTIHAPKERTHDFFYSLVLGQTRLTKLLSES